ncbi:MAG: hypothetical protein CM15mV52_0810 [uncultured marine virus]|nr:MAG: hypothetical protein CM15mV52_0810 [uncultured marine virus]
MSFGSGITSSFGVVVNQGGTFTGGTGAHTMGSFEVNNSNAKMTMTSGECTIDSEKVAITEQYLWKQTQHLTITMVQLKLHTQEILT